MAELQAPVLIKPLPPLVLFEGKEFGPIDLGQYIESPNEESGRVKYYAEIDGTGDELPRQVVCSVEGLFGGKPAKGTKGTVKIAIIAENQSLEALVVRVDLIINELPAVEDPLFFANMKAQVWDALGKNLPVPSANDTLTRPITSAEVYYLMQRFGSMTIWDVYNLETPGPKVPLALPDMSKHYDIFDRGSCIVGAPKSLFSYERTLNDALQTARVMAREVYKRGWTIEFGGFNKMVRAAWIELQVLSDKFNKPIEIMHYTPSGRDLKIYEARVEASRPTP
ncbi:MAG: hypothetical protein V4501_12710 [Pseudomonadota bacterium]